MLKAECLTRVLGESQPECYGYFLLAEAKAEVAEMTDLLAEGAEYAGTADFGVHRYADAGAE